MRALSFGSSLSLFSEMGYTQRPDNRPSQCTRMSHRPSPRLFLFLESEKLFLPISLPFICIRWKRSANLHTHYIYFHTHHFATLGARDFSSAVSGFRPKMCRPSAKHRKFPPHARKTSGTQGIILPSPPENSKSYTRRAGSAVLS